ncbi:MAG: hypothetical protein U5J82_03055 [Desulfobacterales bacterium]|nr:hypothetical protein [Desulfobacterales bacterium]
MNTHTSAEYSILISSGQLAPVLFCLFPLSLLLLVPTAWNFALPE